MTLIRPAKPIDAAAVARIHVGGIPNGFLSSLGIEFLTSFYGRMSSSKNAFLLVAENTGAVVGFVGCATNLQRFYLDFVVHSLPAIGPLLPKLLNPSALRKIFETSRYATRGGGALSDAELLAISVLKGSQGGGVATLLFREAVSEFAKRGAREFRIVSGISDTGVFFEKMGCTVQSETSIHDGVRSVVYLYRISG